MVEEFLAERGVPYTVKAHAQPAVTCEAAAAERGVRVSQIVKCMVGEVDPGQLITMLLPGHRTLKSSKARKWLRAATLELARPERLESLGLTIGAISPFQLLGRSRILMDPSVLDEPFVDVSAGHPLAGIELRSSDLRTLLDADLVDIVSTTSH